MPLATAINFGIGLLGNASQRGNVQRGHSLDNRYSLEKEESLYQRSQDRGLTPQEYYGSSAPGSPGVSGGAQVLGNTQNQQQLLNKKLVGDAVNKSADRALIKRGQDKQIEAANIQAGTQQRGQDITATTAANQLNFSKEKYTSIVLPQAARIAHKTEHEIEQLINQVATSKPAFIKMLKIMTMGTDNTLGLAIQNRLGIDVSDKTQMQNLSSDQMRELIQGMMTAGSVLAKEVSGGQTTVDAYLDSVVRALDAAIKNIKVQFGTGIQPKHQTQYLGTNKEPDIQNTFFKKENRQKRGY